MLHKFKTRELSYHMIMKKTVVGISIINYCSVKVVQENNEDINFLLFHLHTLGTYEVFVEYSEVYHFVTENLKS